MKSLVDLKVSIYKRLASHKGMISLRELQPQPQDFPAWKTVYHYFRIFQKTGLWEQINMQIREAVREK